MGLKLVAWAFVALTVVQHAVIRPFTITGVDFPKHWLAPLAILEGRNNYVGDELWLYYNYPQWSAMVTFWLGWLSRESAEVVWKAMNLGFVGLAGWISWRYFRPGEPEAGTVGGEGRSLRAPIRRGLRREWALATAVIFAGFGPAAKTVLFTGNIDPWNLLAMTAFIAALLRGRERLAGAYWAILCLVKMVPVLLIVPLILWRKWRVLEGWTLFMTGYLALLLATNRVGYEWFFVREVMPEIAFEWRWISISFPQLLLDYVFPAAWNEDPARFHLVMNVTLGTFALGLFAGVGYMKSKRADFLRVLEFAILYLPLLSPLLEGHHYSWTLPALFLQIRRWTAGELHPFAASVYAAGWFLISLDYFYINLMHNLGEWPEYGPLLGGLLLAAAAFGEMWRWSGPPMSVEAGTSRA